MKTRSFGELSMASITSCTQFEGVRLTRKASTIDGSSDSECSNFDSLSDSLSDGVPSRASLDMAHYPCMQIASLTDRV